MFRVYTTHPHPIVHPNTYGPTLPRFVGYSTDRELADDTAKECDGYVEEQA